MTLIPTIRVQCAGCGDDLDCTEKTYQGFQYHCKRCNVRVRMSFGWLNESWPTKETRVFREFHKAD